MRSHRGGPPSFMASIERRHAYRFGYLKSEHWSNLRLSKLVEQDAHCQVCGERDLSNDVHHVVYRPNLCDATLDDLVVLCRDCHETVHAALDSSPWIKHFDDPSERWAATLFEFRVLCVLKHGPRATAIAKLRYRDQAAIITAARRDKRRAETQNADQRSNPLIGV